MTQDELGGMGLGEGRLRAFSARGYVLWSEDGKRAEVSIGGMLIGVFDRSDPRARNVILIGLCQGKRVHFGRLAKAFDISVQTLRMARRLYEKEGLAGLVGGNVRGHGRAPKLQGAAVRAVHRWFTQGVSVVEVQAKLKARRVPVVVSVGLLSNERARWKAGRLTRTEETSTLDEAPDSEPPSGASQGDAACGPLDAPPSVDEDPATADLVVAAADEDEGAAITIEGALPQSGHLVQHLGGWLMLAMVWTMGLHGRFETERAREGREGRRSRASTVRVALDAFVVALAIGQRCIEGVRRLHTPSAGKLLRASTAPTASWIRRVFGRLSGQDGAAHIGLASVGAHVRGAQAATALDEPVVFYVDNHVRPYTGGHVVRKGWRMQDRRARPGITDCWVHDDRGAPVFRIDSPGHESLTSLMPRATMLLRAALGADERILVAFDRGGAFPTQLAQLRDDGMEFVTYERRPFPSLPKSAFTEKLTLGKDDALSWCEAPDKNLGAGRGRVRRIAVRDDHDGHQINLIAISEAPAEWLIGVMRSRWRQENGFKHCVERWGQNHLDSRAIEPYDPDTIIPNPARRRLDRHLHLARTREGEARRYLAVLDNDAPARAAHERDLAQALATQTELLAQRPHVPTHAPLHETELAGRLVRHKPGFKLLVLPSRPLRTKGSSPASR